MASLAATIEEPTDTCGGAPEGSGQRGAAWYAVRVRPNFEAAVAPALQGKGYEVFPPTYTTRKKRRGRTVRLTLPLFPGYVFCRFSFERRLPVLMSPGVVHVVSAGKRPLDVSDHEIRSIMRMTEGTAPVRPWPFVQAGGIVRIAGGPLAGIEGVLMEPNGRPRIALSITLLQRSVSAEVDVDCLEFVRRGALTPSQ